MDKFAYGDVAGKKTAPIVQGGGVILNWRDYTPVKVRGRHDCTESVPTARAHLPLVPPRSPRAADAQLNSLSSRSAHAPRTTHKQQSNVRLALIRTVPCWGHVGSGFGETLVI